MADRGPGSDRGRRGGLPRLVLSSIETALRALEGESVRLRAMALTYISLFALVPALVVAFSVVQAFTGMERLSARVSEFLFENLAVGARATIEPYLQRFVHNAHLTSAGIVGGALLVWSAVSLFSNVDRAVNDVWGIRRRRRLRAQAAIYWVGLTLGPLLLAGSVMVGRALRAFLAGAGGDALAAAGSTLLTCAFFTVLYVIVPDTKVRLGAALAGGVAGGIAWELAKGGYTFAVARFFRYHAIYGSVAAVPIFLLWLFVSWTILLFGARLACVIQYPSTIAAARRHPASEAGREILAGDALLAIAQAYDRGASAPDAADVGEELGIRADDAAQAIGVLREAGLVVALADGGLVPSRPLERITLEDVRRAVAGAEPSEGTGAVARVVASVEEASLRRLAQVTLRELCDAGRRPPSAGAQAPPDAQRAPARPLPGA